MLDGCWLAPPMGGEVAGTAEVRERAVDDRVEVTDWDDVLDVADVADVVVDVDNELEIGNVVEIDVNLAVMGEVMSAPSPRSGGPRSKGVDPDTVPIAAAVAPGIKNLPFCTANANNTAKPIFWLKRYPRMIKLGLRKVGEVIGRLQSQFQLGRRRFA